MSAPRQPPAPGAHEGLVETTAGPGAAAEVFAVALRLGLTSFGGPAAHLGYFRAEYVGRRGWLDEAAYADLVGLCQALPGPSSSEVGIGVGLLRAGVAGGFAAWLGFTAPSAVLLLLLGLGVAHANVQDVGWVNGLRVAAVAVVAQAVWGMARQFLPDSGRRVLAVLAAILLLILPGGITQVAVIAGGAIVGMRFLAQRTPPPPLHGKPPVSRRLGVAALATFVGVLFLLPLLADVLHSPTLTFVDAFYRSGALVFGGGHVVLPVLHAAVVAPGWVGDTRFIEGYGAAQAIPGPLFTFAAFLGATASSSVPHGWLGGVLALLGIFLPGGLLVVGVLPFWHDLRARPGVQGALSGVNAVVVGILLAALYNPLWTSAVATWRDVLVAVVAFGLLMAAKQPSWRVAAFAALAGALFL